MLTLFQGIRARRLAEQLCRKLHPSEPAQGSVVCADEPTRFVVRVFCGRPTTPDLLWPKPKWGVCVIVAVDKYTQEAEQVVDDTPYRPLLR